MPPFDPPATTTTWTTNNLNITGTDELWTRTFPYAYTHVDATPRTFTWNTPEYVEKSELENIFKRIYNIIREHTAIDISEEEFINILEEKDDR